MYRATLAILLISLIQFGELRKYYYPDTKDPNAIVFDGPTNAETRDAPEKKPEPPADNDIDEDYDLDVRFGDGCPAGYYSQGTLCFPEE